jgi:hypothetical protein
MWQALQNQSDVDHMMATYRGFHDSCIKELGVQLREYVDAKRAMHFDNQTIVRMRFQSQFNDNAVLDLVLEDVITLNWVQDERNADTGLSVIYQAICLWQNEMLYWSEDVDWSMQATDRNEYRWIAAKRGRWRIVEDAMGPDTALFALD